jgi:hypothetical protein
MRIHVDQCIDTVPIQNVIETLKCVSADQTIIDEVLQTDDENVIFIDSEADRLAPLDEFDDYTLYNILTLDFKDKNVYYVTSDFNIWSNLNRLKKIISCNEIKTDIIPLINPYMYGFFNDYEIESSSASQTELPHSNAKIGCVNINNFSLTVDDKKIEYEPKYNVISLNSTKKHQRIKTIKALRGIENFMYSYYPFEDPQQMEDVFDNDEDNELLNELTELNEIYDPLLFMKKSEVPLNFRSKKDISKTFASKHDAFQRCVPLEYIQSCIDLVTESYVDESIALTEKTFKPISLNKPFILLSARNSHQFLKKAGFYLYEELFDYSFDDKSFDQRFDSIMKQIKPILAMSTHHLTAKIETFREKIQYNCFHVANQKQIWYIASELDDFNYLKFMINEQKAFV